MQTIDKPLSNDFESPNYLTMIAYFGNIYKHELITVACCLGSFLAGRFLQPAHPIEKCIKKFSSTSKSESQIKTVLQTSRRVTSYIKRTLFLVGLLIVSYLSFILYTHPTWLTRVKALDLHAVAMMASHIKLFAALGLLVFSSFLVRCYARIYERRLISKLNNTASSKRMYIEKLFGLFGPELIQEIQNFLQIPKETEPDHTHRPQQDNAKQELAHANNSLREEVDYLKSSIAKTKSKLAVKEKILSVNENFMNSMMSFEWCAQCYDDKRIEEFVQQQGDKVKTPAIPVDGKTSTTNKAEQTPKKIEQTSDSQTNDESRLTATDVETPKDRTEGLSEGPASCQSNCLIRFHILCDQLAQKMRADLESVRFRKINNG